MDWENAHGILMGVFSTGSRYLNVTTLSLGATGVALLYIIRSYIQVRIPGPTGLDYFKCLRELGRRPTYLVFTDLVRRYGPVVQLDLVFTRLILLGSPQLVRECFNNPACTERPDSYIGTHIIRLLGLIFASGKRWEYQRTFTKDCIRELGTTRQHDNTARERLQTMILQEVDKLIQFLHETHGEPFSTDLTILKIVGKITQGLVLGPYYGTDVAKRQAIFERQMETVDAGSQLISKLAPLNVLLCLRYVPFYRRLEQQAFRDKREINEYMTTAIMHRKRAREESGNVGCEANDPPLPHPPVNKESVLDAFLANMEKPDAKKYYFEDDQFLQLLTDLQGAALDTTKNTLLWILLYITKYPDVQTRIHSELDRVVGGTGRPTLEHMSQLTYIQATVWEIQRITTVVPLGVPHLAAKPIELGGHIIPKNAIIMPMLHAIHTDPELWDQPDVYNPDRFLNSDGSLIQHKAFIPFSTGLRVCIGQEYAKIEMFLLISNVLHNFRFYFPPDTNPSLTPVSGFTNSPIPYTLIAKSRT